MATTDGYELITNLRGPSLELKKIGSFLQWRVAGSGGAWSGLLPLADIQGLPGGNAVANDAATAGYISTAGSSATKSALQKHFTEILTPEQFGATGSGEGNDGEALRAMAAQIQPGTLVRGRPGAIYQYDGGFEVNGVDDWTMEHLNLKYSDGTVVQNGDARALTITNCSNFLMSNMRVEVVNQVGQQSGVVIDDSVRGKLRKVEVFNARWIGIGLGGGYQVVVEDCVALQCRFGLWSSCVGAEVRGGFYSSQWSQTAEYVAKGGVWDTTSLYYDGAIMSGDEWLIDGATFDDNGQSGIYSAGGNRPTVTRSKLRGNHNKGIDFGPDAANTIIQPVLTDNILTLNATGNLSVVNTIEGVIAGNAIDMGAVGSFGIGLHDGCYRNIVSNNSIITAHPTAWAIYVEQNGDNPAINNTFGVNLSRANVPDSVDWTTNKRVIAV